MIVEKTEKRSNINISKMKKKKHIFLMVSYRPPVPNITIRILTDQKTCPSLSLYCNHPQFNDIML